MCDLWVQVVDKRAVETVSTIGDYDNTDRNGIYE
jgi:hypothetical protein